MGKGSKFEVTVRSLKGKIMGVLALWLQSVNDLWRQETPPQGGIDLGNGRVMGAEDVLEGHYRRMTSHRQPFSGRAATHQVRVQVGDNLTAAITVLAPQLLPYTEVAEQVSDALPLVEPEEHFRQNLHQALERTHRQHAAQRVLGTRPVPRAKQSNPLGWWMVIAGAIAAFVLVWGVRSRQNPLPAS
jgi:hypothetical protein